MSTAAELLARLNAHPDWWVYDANWCIWCDALCTVLDDEAPTIRRLADDDVPHTPDCPVPAILAFRDA